MNTDEEILKILKENGEIYSKCIIDHPNLSNFECPICHTNAYKPITLISVTGTEDGNKVMAVQVHIDCIDLTFVEGPDKSIWLVQFLENNWNEFYKKVVGDA